MATSLQLDISNPANMKPAVIMTFVIMVLATVTRNRECTNHFHFPDFLRALVETLRNMSLFLKHLLICLVLGGVQDKFADKIGAQSFICRQVNKFCRQNCLLVEVFLFRMRMNIHKYTITVKRFLLTKGKLLGNCAQNDHK